MELLQLKYFRDAAISENFSQVAEKYYVPQSSISHTISRLEDELGVKLFTRNGRKVRLNEAGKAFYEEIDAALAKIEKGVRRVKDLKHNTVRLSMVQGTVAMIPLIAEFQKQNPDVEITFANPSDRLKGNLFFDLRIGTKPSASEKNCSSMPLFVERILIAVPASHPLAKKKALTIDDIRGIPVIGLYPNSGMYNLMNAYFVQNEYAPEIKVESENHNTVAQFVKGGYGIAFYPEISWSAVGTDGIASLPFADFDGKRTVYIFWPNDYPKSEATDKFIEFAVEWFKKGR
ncbi:MAG: LysR family transcriptional regulator [Clostridia bacterium]|nr:LysR family transcriptional regulator [Clostridia bacterium]